MYFKKYSLTNECEKKKSQGQYANDQGLEMDIPVYNEIEESLLLSEQKPEILFLGKKMSSLGKMTM